MLHLPLAETMRRIVPFFYPSPCELLDVTAGKKLMWKNMLGSINTDTLAPHEKNGYSVTFSDILPQFPDVIQAHSYHLPFEDQSFDVLVSDYPFTPSLMDDRLNDSRVRAHYSKNHEKRLFYQNSMVEADQSRWEKYPQGRLGTKPRDELYSNSLAEAENLPKRHAFQPHNWSIKHAGDFRKQASTYTGLVQADDGKIDPSSPANRFSKTRHTALTERWEYYKQKTSPTYSNEFIPPRINFENTVKECNRIARKGLIVKIGEYHQDYHYYPGDVEAITTYDKRWNPESEFEAVARIFYKGVRPMVHQVPHPQPVVTFYCVFMRDIRERGIWPRRRRRKTKGLDSATRAPRLGEAAPRHDPSV